MRKETEHIDGLPQLVTVEGRRAILQGRAADGKLRGYPGFIMRQPEPGTVTVHFALFDHEADPDKPAALVIDPTPVPILEKFRLKMRENAVWRFEDLLAVPVNLE